MFPRRMQSCGLQRRDGKRPRLRHTSPGLFGFKFKDLMTGGGVGPFLDPRGLLGKALSRSEGSRLVTDETTPSQLCTHGHFMVVHCQIREEYNERSSSHPRPVFPRKVSVVCTLRCVMLCCVVCLCVCFHSIGLNGTNPNDKSQGVCAFPK